MDLSKTAKKGNNFGYEIDLFVEDPFKKFWYVG